MTVRDIHNAKTGKVSDKWDSYLDYYEDIFSPKRNDAVSLFEVGVQNGGSLDTYAQYFKNGVAFVGCDINERCRGLSYSDKRIHVVVGDANTAAAYQDVTAIANAFDFIIDDGSHVSKDILQSFVKYFPLLKPGSKYVVEDTHALYKRRYGGGILNDFSAYAFFKKLVDVVSYEWWSDDVTLDDYLATFCPSGAPQFIAQGWVDSVEFRNSIITINKAKTPSHNKLGARLAKGTEFLVRDWGNNLPATPYG